MYVCYAFAGMSDRYNPYGKDEGFEAHKSIQSKQDIISKVIG